MRAARLLFLLPVVAVAWLALGAPVNPPAASRLEARQGAMPVVAPQGLKDAPEDNKGPGHQALLAAGFLATMEAQEAGSAKHVRFVSLYAVPPERRFNFAKLLTWWLNSMSFNQAIARLQVVAGSFGQLLWLDLRDFNWLAAAWRAVALREPFFREPFVPPDAALALRSLIGAEVDRATFHVEAIVRADWLVRETIESFRSPSYYDLLFAKQRFVSGSRTVTESITAKETVTVNVERTVEERVYDAALGGYVLRRRVVTVPEAQERSVVKQVERVVEGAQAVDFPKDRADWEKAFGAEDARKFLARQKVKAEKGAVVAGMTEDLKNGSLVARHNRLVRVLLVPTGAYLETFDVKEASGKKDYIEQAPDLAKGKIDFDAQELLAALPNGSQAGLLTNGAGKRVEVADSDVAVGPDKTFPQVRNPGDCVICHAPSDGMIPPRNLVKDVLDLGIDLKFKRREDRNDFAGFYLHWERRIAGLQEPYKVFTELATTDPYKAPDAPDNRPWSGTEVSRQLADFRRWYDAPVSPEQAAREVGVNQIKPLAVNLTSARAALLARGVPTPRPAFDKDVYKGLAALKAAEVAIK